MEWSVEWLLDSAVVERLVEWTVVERLNKGLVDLAAFGTLLILSA